MQGKGHIIVFLFRVILGSLFILASIDKILYPDNFYYIVKSYELLPEPLIAYIAGILPWLEFLIGITLVFGIAVKSSALLACFLLIFFLSGLSINYYRGNLINCGCYTVLFKMLEMEEKISISSILRDLGILLMGVMVFCFDREYFSLNSFISRLLDRKNFPELTTAKYRK